MMLLRTGKNGKGSITKTYKYVRPVGITPFRSTGRRPDRMSRSSDPFGFVERIIVRSTAIITLLITAVQIILGHLQ